MKFRALRLDKGRLQVDLVKAAFLFLKHYVFEPEGPLCTWQKRLPDDTKTVASCAKQSTLNYNLFTALLCCTLHNYNLS